MESVHQRAKPDTPADAKKIIIGIAKSAKTRVCQIRVQIWKIQQENATSKHSIPTHVNVTRTHLGTVQLVPQTQVTLVTPETLVIQETLELRQYVMTTHATMSKIQPESAYLKPMFIRVNVTGTISGTTLSV